MVSILLSLYIDDEGGNKEFALALSWLSHQFKAFLHTVKACFVSGNREDKSNLSRAMWLESYTYTYSEYFYLMK